MKPIHIIAGLGATGLIALVAWIMYLSSAPLTGQSIRRGLSPEFLGAAKPSAVTAPVTPATPKAPPVPAPGTP